MRTPWVNTALLILVLLQLVSGFLGFVLVDTPVLIYRLHGIGGFSLALLLTWKGLIILDSFRRDLHIGVRRSLFILLTLGLLGVLVTGLFWTWDGPRYVQGLSLLTWHVVLAVLILGLFGWHTWYMRFVFKHPDSRNRWSFIRSGLIGIGGLAFWQMSGVTKTILALRGAQRRITGSYETGSYTGKFPGVIWLADSVDPIRPEAWQLRIDGAVGQPLRLSLEDLLAYPSTELVATLDCTGGWYTTQIWTGVRLIEILESATSAPEAKSVTVFSVSGYSRRFSLTELDHFLLATRVAGEPLPHIHGAPIRLVAPGYRGFAWVKWVSHLRVNETGPLWQPPLPLQ